MFPFQTGGHFRQRKWEHLPEGVKERFCYVGETNGAKTECYSKNKDSPLDKGRKIGT